MKRYGWVTSPLCHLITQSLSLASQPVSNPAATTLTYTQPSLLFQYSLGWPACLPACLQCCMHACMVSWCGPQWSVEVLWCVNGTGCLAWAHVPATHMRLRDSSAHVGWRLCDRPQCYWVRQLDYCSTIGPLVCMISTSHCVCIGCICAHACACNK